jgi:hypothetical protein
MSVEAIEGRYPRGVQVLVDALGVALGGGYFVVVAVDEGGTQFMSLLRNWNAIKWVAAGRSCGLAV